MNRSSYKPDSQSLLIGSPLATWGLALCAVLLTGGCATVKPPQPLDEIPFLERSQTQERDGVRITVAAMSEDEARSAFGVNLSKKRIQPVWIDIENSTDQQFYLMLSPIDPRYYSAMEAAYLFHKAGNPTRNEQLDQYFESQKVGRDLQAGSRISGFVYANLKRGTREVRVRLLSEGAIEDFEFYVSVPGLKADWERVDFHSIYSEDEFVHYDDDDAAFAEALRALPCCTTKKDGTGAGDPINIVVIGEPDNILAPFIAAGWDETEITTAGTSWKTFKSFFGAEYKYSPISALYIYLRPQDAGLQKARDTINERNHLRLWLAPMTYNGKLVFVGGMSRDIGVRMTTKAWNLTTHEIDPDIDEARNYLIEDLATAGRIATFGLIDGVGYASKDDPMHNHLGSPWWTDGHRLVMELSKTPVALDAIETFSFHVPMLPVQASETPNVRGQTEASGPDGGP
jgi:hypothetical protein